MRGTRLDRAIRDRIKDRLYDVVRALAVTFLLVQIFSVSYIVFGRFVLSKSPAWGEELALLCMVWFSLLSTAMAEFSGSHINVGINKFFIPKIGLHLVALLNHVLKIIFSSIMIVAGLQLVETTKGGKMPGLDISPAFLYLSVPLSGFFFLLMLILRTKEVLQWEIR